MLTADTLKTLVNLGPSGLAHLLATCGYTGTSFQTAKFLGITNGGQLCYQVSFFDDSGTGDTGTEKVYISYDHVNNSITADF